MKVYIGEKDEVLLADPGLNLSFDFIGRPFSTKADVFLQDGEELELIGLHIKCLEVSGHTKGGICYYIESLNAVFDGDTLFHGSIGRSDFPTGDPAALVNGIKEKLFSLPDETVVLPGHDSTTTIGKEKKYNLYLE